MIDQLVAEPFDVHRIAGRKITEAFFDLRRAGVVRAANENAFFVFNERRLALGADRRKGKLRQIVGPAMRFDPNDVRNHLAGLFYDHEVADANVFAFDFFRVVQAGAAHRRPGEFDRLQVGDRRDRARLADLHANAVQLRLGLILFELVGDYPPRRLRRAAELFALGIVVHLEHEPVDLEVEFVQSLDDRLAVGGRLVK